MEKSAIEEAVALLIELEECEGPCGKLCLHCPEAYALEHIKKVVHLLMMELEDQTDEANYYKHLSTLREG